MSVLWNAYKPLLTWKNLYYILAFFAMIVSFPLSVWYVVMGDIPHLYRFPLLFMLYLAALKLAQGFRKKK